MTFRTRRAAAALVRVKRRVTRPARPYGREVIGRPGETLSLDEAISRGLTEDDIEGVGIAASSVLDQFRTLRAAAENDEPEEVDPEANHWMNPNEVRAVEGLTPVAPPPAPEEFPRHRGGPNWELSDGSTFKGSKVSATEAEAELQKAKDATGSATPDAKDGDPSKGDDKGEDATGSATPDAKDGDPSKGDDKGEDATDGAKDGDPSKGGGQGKGGDKGKGDAEGSEKP